MTETQGAPAQEQETEAAAEAETSAAPTVVRPGRVALWVLGVAAVLTLGGVVYSLYDQTGMVEGLDQTGVMILTLSLFSPIIVTAFAGAVAALIAPRLFKGPQKALALLGALIVGLISGGTIYALYSVDAAIALTLGFVLLGSALVGGTIALSKRSVVLAAGLSAMLVLLAFMFARGLINTVPALSVFSDPIDEYNTVGTLAPFLAGLACGICAFLYLRKKKAGVKLIGHLFAGAIPGAIWLLSTIIAQISVETIIAVGVDDLFIADSANLALMFQTQYNGSMTVMFAGAFCAILAFGLLLPKSPKAKAAKRS